MINQYIFKNSFKKILLLLVTAAIAGCSGSDSGTSSSNNTSNSVSLTGVVVGLTLPGKVSVVTASDSNSAAVGAIAAGALANTGGYSATSDYMKDQTQTWVYDPSMESLNTVNEILCYVQQIGADEMVNEGAYIALVNEKKCKQGQNTSGGQGGSTQGAATNTAGAEAGKFQKWIVESTRADNSSPQFVKIWVPSTQKNADNPMDASVILVEVTINESPSDSKPFGDFTLNFKGVSEQAFPTMGVNTGDPVMTGTLKSVDNTQATPQFSFINLSGDAMPGATGFGFSMAEATNVVMDDYSATSGKAVTSRAESGFGGPAKNMKFAVAYNATGFKRGKDVDGDSVVDGTVCTDRSKLDTKVWRYNLYNAADGSAVAVNSGFPFSAVNGT